MIHHNNDNNMKVTVVPIVVGPFEMVLKGLKRKLEKKRKHQNHPDHSSVKISKNT